MSDYEFSWISRPLNGMLILPGVRNQGRCPSCVFHAFCLAAEIERRRILALLEPPNSTDFLYDVPSFIADYEMSIGRPLGDVYHHGYDYGPGRVCSAGHLLLHFGVAARCGGHSMARRVRLEGVDAHGLLNFGEVAALINQGRPVIGGFTTNRLFNRLGRNDIYSYTYMPDEEPANHMVVFVGFGRSGGRAYLLFMNSAGTGFGQEGFGRVWFDEVRDYYTVRTQGQPIATNALIHGPRQSYTQRASSSFRTAASTSTFYGASSSSQGYPQQGAQAPPAYGQSAISTSNAMTRVDDEEEDKEVS